MSRKARVVVPNCAHHITQRGNRREKIFFKVGDEEIYLDLMAQQLERYNIECWSYCLMPNHVHFILVPPNEECLSRAIGEAHRRYTQFIGIRDKWSGHLFQDRFYSVAMDDDHLKTAFKYVALNPVKAKLIKFAIDWQYSSTRAIIEKTSNKYVRVDKANKIFHNYAKFIAKESNVDAQLWDEIRMHEFTGRPVGAKEWLENLEKKFAGKILPKKRGPKPKIISD